MSARKTGGRDPEPEPTEGSPTLRVVAAVIQAGGQVLLSRRPRGTHLGGLWEFPGGKVEAGESDAQALARELREEIDVEVEVGPLLHRTRHAYPDRIVDLAFYACTLRAGVPRAREVAEVAWHPLSALRHLGLPPADAPLVDRLLAGQDGRD